MTTDPKELPHSDDETGNRDVDPVTGYDLTGHDWGGITELNTPLPRAAVIAMWATVIYSVIAWILLPAWPTLRTYTPGILGLDQSEMAVERLEKVVDMRQDWVKQFAVPDFEAIAADPQLLANAMPAAERLYEDNCLACHGENGGGGPGFPVLNDADWLFGGDPETIVETLHVGVNSTHPDTRISQMPAFDWLERDQRLQVAEYVTQLPSGTADHDGAGGQLFEENCSSCHGEKGVGGLLIGAPSLVNDSVIYGQDLQTVLNTLQHGRAGVMPSWEGRLSDEQINLLALYVTRLAEKPVETQ